MGQRGAKEVRLGLRQAGAAQHPRAVGRLRLAPRLSLAAAAGWVDRRGLPGIGAAAARRRCWTLAGDHGCVFGYELHPGSDLFDGATFESFLEHTEDHPAACINYDPSHLLLQQLDYLEFIQLYGQRITGFHVKDVEFRPSGRVGVYGGYQPWAKRAGRFRSLGDGQVDFKRVFTLLTEADFDGWAVMEWECCVKSPEQGAAEGAPFVARHIIEATTVAFDDFAGGKSDPASNRRMLGLE